MSLGICALDVLSSPVLAATGANAMGQSGFTAFAIHDIWNGDVVMGTAHVSSGLGHFFLGQWHDGTSMANALYVVLM
jgi:hypothetical protein